MTDKGKKDTNVNTGGGAPPTGPKQPKPPVIVANPVIQGELREGDDGKH